MVNRCLITHSLMPVNAARHVRQQQRIATPVCSGQASEWFPRCAVSSPSTVRHQVFFGRPHLRFPSGVQCRAVQVMLPCFLWVTCLIHLHHLHIMMVSMLSWLRWEKFNFKTYKVQISI